MTYLCIKC